MKNFIKFIKFADIYLVLFAVTVGIGIYAGLHDSIVNMTAAGLFSLVGLSGAVLRLYKRELYIEELQKEVKSLIKESTKLIKNKKKNENNNC